MERNSNKTWRRQFEEDCLRLRQNDATFTSLSTHMAYREDIQDDVFLLLGRSLMNNTHLKELSLFQPVLAEQPARALAKGIAQSNLKSIDFVYTFCSGQEEPPFIWRIFLLEGIQSLRSLEVINIQSASGLAQMDEFGEVLSSLPNLKTLTYTSRRSASEDFRSGLQFSQVLVRTSSLLRLHLDGIAFGKTGITLVAHGLRCNVLVEQLSLISCDIDDACLELFLELWQRDSPVQSLILDYNRIGTPGALKLLRAVAEHPTMQQLSLDSNKSISYEGLRMIGEEIACCWRDDYKPHFLNISLSDCATPVDYDDPSCSQALAQQKASQQAGQALLDGTRRNFFITGLTTKSYCTNEHVLPLDVVNGISFYTNLNEMGRYLLSSDHHRVLPSTIWCYILAKSRHKRVRESSLIYFFLCEQPTLVKPRHKRPFSYITGINGET